MYKRQVEYGYSTDVLCLDADSQKAVHIMSILPTMNALTVEEGRMPEKFDECVVDTDFLSESQYKVGDTIVFSSGTDDALEYTLKTDSYKIVGAVSVSYTHLDVYKRQNLSGGVWAMLSIVLGNVWECSYKTVLLCAFISYMIIMQSRMKFLAFIPGAYIGCFITFAAEGNWRAVLPALVLGVILGWMTDVTSAKLYHWIGNGRSMQEESSLLPSEIK